MPPERARDDRSLLARLQQGDATALEALFREHYVPLCRYARRFCPSISDAEDAVAEVFADVWARRADLRVRTTLKTYLYGAVRKKTLQSTQRTERRRRRLETVDGAPAMGQHPPLPDAAAEADELERRVREALRALPDRPREAIVLRRRHGLPYAEIAEVMGVSRKTVENHLNRARRLLRHLLDDLL